MQLERLKMSTTWIMLSNENCRGCQLNRYSSATRKHEGAKSLDTVGQSSIFLDGTNLSSCATREDEDVN